MSRFFSEKFNTLNLVFNHMVNSVYTSTTNTDNLNFSFS